MYTNVDTRGSSVTPPVTNSPKSRKPVPKKSIPSNKYNGIFRIIRNGDDLTPEPLNPLRSADRPKEQRISVYESSGNVSQSVTDLKVFQTQSIARFHTELHKQTIQAVRYSQSCISSDCPDDVIIEPERKESSSSTESLVTAPSERLGVAEEGEEQPTSMPTHISLILAETPTFFLLDVPSKTVEKDTPEAFAVETENERYEYLTVGKGRNRKMVQAEVQTTQILKKTRCTEAERISHRHNHTFASNWELFDTYKFVSETKLKSTKESLDEKKEVLDLSSKNQDKQLLSEDMQMNKLMQNERFLEAICVIERLLANNNYNEQQKRFKGLSDPDPFREDIEYKYRLDLLWTFANKETTGRCVSAMCWNKLNPDILAVGYGKFYYTDVATGMVLIWNVKNPVQPERSYQFDQPVTAINFSKQNPNLLGIGFYDGVVLLLDVTSRKPQIIGKSGRDLPSFEPIWQIVFYQGSDYFKDTEQIITSGQDGRIIHFRQQDTVELIYSQIMRIARPEGKLKGIATLRRCHAPGIPILRYTPALAIQQHPVDLNIYYVGTNQGTVHKCSRNYYHQHLDLFLAHDGAIYEMKFSPFCNKLYLTCGDDWYIRIWADGIVEPLFELSKTMQSVQGADWSPTHSTIIANISGSDICIWDLQRKTYKPQSITTSPSNNRNTVIQFTESGRCLVVGDIEGNVHVYALEDMPFSAFFQDDLLSTSIIRGLITRPDLIRKLKKLGSLNFDKAQFQKHFKN